MVIPVVITVYQDKSFTFITKSPPASILLKKAAGITASCHSLRHTFASNLLEHGAEVVAIRDFLGHSQIASSERYAKVSSQKVKQEYMRTMQKILKQGQV